MSKEIIGKVRETEQIIDSMKIEFEKRKDKLRENQKENIKNYQKELQNTLDDFVAEKKADSNKQVHELSDRVSHEVESFRRQLESDYQTHKDELIQVGIKEVLSQYGDFSNETSSHSR